MNRAIAFADAVAARSASVLTQRETRSEACRVGKVPFRLVAPFEHGKRWIGSALLRNGTDSPDEGEDYAIRIWDGTSPEMSPPPRPWGPAAHEPLGLIEGYCDETVRCAFDIHTSSLIVHHGGQNAGYIWYPDLDSLPAWAQASPFRIPLSWLANRHGMQIVHAAAVAVAGRAVLLAGAGGSGKSTTALACALSGMSYLGDDYCVVEPASRQVHMLYKSAKLLRRSLEILPRVQPWLVNADRIEQEKGVMFLDSSQLPIVDSAEIAAILLPRVAGNSTTELRRGTSRDALHAILPSTVGGLMGGTAATPSLLMKLGGSVPVYHLDLGTEMDGVVDAVSSALERSHG